MDLKDFNAGRPGDIGIMADGFTCIFSLYFPDQTGNRGRDWFALDC